MPIQKIIRGILYKTGIGKGIAKRFWREIDHHPEYEYLYQNKEKVFEQIPVNFSDKEVTEFIKKDSEKWSLQEEFVVLIKEVTVEPERGLGIKGFNQLVGETKVIDEQYPYIIPYLLNRHRAIMIEEAVLYDGSATNNYYHHFLNVFNSLHMLDKVNLPVAIPLIITRKSFNSKYFQYIYTRNKWVQSLNWLIQEPDEWYKVKRLYKLQCIHFGKEPWMKTRALYAIPDIEPYRKVFLSRDTTRYDRGLVNEKEISDLLQKYGFETVYAEHLTIEEQTELFKTTKYLIALHGAGLVQQFFMNYEKAHVIEIMPRDRLMPLYYWQAYTLGIRFFDIVVGSRLDKRKNYFLDPITLKKAVEKMLNNDNNNSVLLKKPSSDSIGQEGLR